MTEIENIMAELTVAQCELRRMLSKSEAFDDISARFVDNVMPAELLEISTEVLNRVETSTESFLADIAKGLEKVVKFIMDLLDKLFKWVFSNNRKLDAIISKVKAMRAKEPGQLNAGLYNMNTSPSKHAVYLCIEALFNLNQGMPTLVSDFTKYADLVKANDKSAGFNILNNNECMVALRILGFEIDENLEVWERTDGSSTRSLVPPQTVLDHLITVLKDGTLGISEARTGRARPGGKDDSPDSWTGDEFLDTLLRLSKVNSDLKRVKTKSIENQSQVLQKQMEDDGKQALALQMFKIVGMIIQVHTRTSMWVITEMLRMGNYVTSASTAGTVSAK